MLQRTAERHTTDTVSKIYLFRFKGRNQNTNKSGDNSREDTPVPISNTEVKLLSADDTWREAAWESRTLPVFYCKSNKKATEKT